MYFQVPCGPVLYIHVQCTCTCVYMYTYRVHVINSLVPNSLTSQTYGITVQHATKSEIGVLKNKGVVGGKAGRCALFSARDVCRMFHHWKGLAPQPLRELAEGKVVLHVHVYKCTYMYKFFIYMYACTLLQVQMYIHVHVL